MVILNLLMISLVNGPGDENISCVFMLFVVPLCTWYLIRLERAGRSQETVVKWTRYLFLFFLPFTVLRFVNRISPTPGIVNGGMVILGVGLATVALASLASYSVSRSRHRKRDGDTGQR